MFRRYQCVTRGVKVNQKVLRGVRKYQEYQGNKDIESINGILGIGFM